MSESSEAVPAQPEASSSSADETGAEATHGADAVAGSASSTPEQATARTTARGAGSAKAKRARGGRPATRQTAATVAPLEVPGGPAAPDAAPLPAAASTASAPMTDAPGPSSAPKATVAHEVAVDDLLGPLPPTRTRQKTSKKKGFTLAAPPPVPAAAPEPAFEPNELAYGPPSVHELPIVSPPRRHEVRAARRLQARKVSRLVRHIDLWSLLKVALLFYICLLLIGVVAGVLVWSALQRSGAVTSVEGFIEQIFLLDDFTFVGRDIFRIGVLAGLVGVLVLTLLTVLGGLMFNLISDLTGGVRLSVVELESARPLRPRRGR